jgi:hypothetical protein
MLYSPSDPLGGSEEEEEMDWAVNLGGVSTLYEDLEDLEPVTTTGTGTGTGSSLEGEKQAAVEPHPAESAAAATEGSSKEVAASPRDGEGPASAGGGGGAGGPDSAGTDSTQPNVQRDELAAPTRTQQLKQIEQQMAANSVDPAAADANADATAVAAAAALNIRRYLMKKKEEEVARLRQAIGNKALAYDSVLEARRRRLAAPTLIGGVETALPGIGTMMSGGDGRLLLTHLETSIGQQRTVTSTFSVMDGLVKCQCKREHSSNSGGGGEADNRTVFILADHASPASWEHTMERPASRS